MEVMKTIFQVLKGIFLLPSAAVLMVLCGFYVLAESFDKGSKEANQMAELQKRMKNGELTEAQAKQAFNQWSASNSGDKKEVK